MVKEMVLSVILLGCSGAFPPELNTCWEKELNEKKKRIIIICSFKKIMA
jgi:hypothetical protein